MTARQQDSPEVARLRELFGCHARQVFGYALRHLGTSGSADVATAQDVVAEVFLVAWRRIDEIPDNALPWLLVTARNVLANTWRAASRRQRLTDALSGVERAAATSPAAEETVVARAEVIAALGELSSVEREAILLVAWDGLSAAGAAIVAGCSTRAFEVRLSRARARLDRVLAEPISHVAVMNEVRR